VDPTPPNKAGKPNIRAFHHRGTQVSLGGEAFAVRLVIRENADGHLYYENDATSIDLLQNESGEKSSSQPGRKPNAGEDQTALANKRLLQWLAGVNRPGFRNTDFIGRRQDGSTTLFGELVNLAAGAVKAGVAFARWAPDIVSRFGARGGAGMEAEGVFWRYCHKLLNGSWKKMRKRYRKTQEKFKFLDDARPRGATI
jgi:hypothetical protein